MIHSLEKTSWSTDVFIFSFGGQAKETLIFTYLTFCNTISSPPTLHMVKSWQKCYHTKYLITILTFQYPHVLQYCVSCPLPSSAPPPFHSQSAESQVPALEMGDKHSGIMQTKSPEYDINTSILFKSKIILKKKKKKVYTHIIQHTQVECLFANFKVRSGEDTQDIHCQLLQYLLLLGCIFQGHKAVKDDQLDIVVTLLHNQLNIAVCCSL